MNLRAITFLLVALWAGEALAQDPPPTFRGPDPLTPLSVTFGHDPLPSGGDWRPGWEQVTFAIGGELGTDATNHASWQVGIFSDRKRNPGITGDYWSGGLLVWTRTHDDWVLPEGARANVAASLISTIASDATGIMAEGIVTVTEIEPGGEGVLIGHETWVINNAGENPRHCDDPRNLEPPIVGCKTGIWMVAEGSARSSWVMDTAEHGPGWRNGIGLRNVARGGTALEIPDQTFIKAGDVPILYVESGHVYLYGSGGALIEVGSLLRRLAAVEARLGIQ